MMNLGGMQLFNMPPEMKVLAIQTQWSKIGKVFGSYSPMHSYNEHRFKSQVNNALAAVRKILHVSRHPTYAAEVFHRYDDKYMLVEFLTNAALAAQVNCLELLGLTPDALDTLQKWANDRSVTLRLTSEETCTFVKSKERKVETPTLVTETTGILGNKTKTQKIVEKVTDHYWTYTVHNEIFLFKGNDQKTKITLQDRQGTCEVITTHEASPYPTSTVQPPLDVNITWFLSVLKENKTFKFSIDRNNSKCRTPRRNTEVTAALDFMTDLSLWASRVDSYFRHSIFPAQKKHDLDLSKINDDGVFIPVLPLFEEGHDNTATTKSTAIVSVDKPKSTFLLSAGDVNLFLAEQKRGLEEKFGGFLKMFPDNGKLITFHEARILAVISTIRRVTQHYQDGVDYVEGMLRSQLVAAIGKEVIPNDFSEYMLYHYRKIFRPEFQPHPFSYAIRQPAHDLEGVIDILDSNSESVFTLVRHSQARHPMKFSISAGTEISFLETRDTPTQLTLNARARQFSCFMLMIGTIGGVDTFEPKYAIIVKNKDDLKLPLILEQLPTPKEFQDAIESLSPEQQRFAKAYRGMQLAGTLFAVCVLQIRPQLEKLLKLPHDSLMKEIVLTQELLELFMEYQIPSDLLSYDGDEDAEVEEKLENVRNNALTMRRMINAAKARADEEERQRREKERLEKERLERERLERERAEKERERAEALRRLEESVNLVEGSSSQVFAKGGGNKNIKKRKVMKEKEREKRDYRKADREECKSKCESRAVMDDMDIMSCASLACTNLADFSDGIVADAKPAAPLDLPADTQSQLQPVAETDNTTSNNMDNQPEEKDNKHDKDATDKEIQEHPLDEQQYLDEMEDYTKIPALLESNYSLLDEDACLRPTTIKVGETWTKESQKTLLSPPFTSIVTTEQQEDARAKAFDLLDALSRSGCLSFGEHASLHVIICATHGFDKSIMDTIIQDNVNPIEKLERSLLIVATTVQKKTALELVKPEELDVVRTFSPQLFLPPTGPATTTTTPSLVSAEKSEHHKASRKGKEKEKEKH